MEKTRNKKPSHPARPVAIRGSLSARQWQDLRQAARFARSEGVTLLMHGVKIFGDKPAAGSRPQVKETPRTSGGSRASDDADEPARATKKAQRDAQRAQANRARVREARWRAFAKRLRYDHIVMPVWTQHMRSRMSPRRDARRKLRGVLWREWTRPQFEMGGGSAAPFGETSSLGLLSHRDRYILRCANALMHRAFPDEPIDPMVRDDLHLEDQMVQAALLASLEDTPSETQGGGRTDATRSLSEAGIQTPGSARRGKKKRGGRSL